MQNYKIQDKLVNKAINKLLFFIIISLFSKNLQGTNYFKSLFNIKEENNSNNKNEESIKNKGTATHKEKAENMESKKEAQNNKLSLTNKAKNTENNNQINSIADLDNAIKSNRFIILKFYSDQCGPCKMMSPTMEKIKKDYSDKLKIFDINAWEKEDIASKYNILNIPALIFLENGEIKGNTIGLKTEREIKEKIKEYFNL